MIWINDNQSKQVDFVTTCRIMRAVHQNYNGVIPFRTFRTGWFGESDPFRSGGGIEFVTTEVLGDPNKSFELDTYMFCDISKIPITWEALPIMMRTTDMLMNQYSGVHEYVMHSPLRPVELRINDWDEDESLHIVTCEASMWEVNMHLDDGALIIPRITDENEPDEEIHNYVIGIIHEKYVQVIRCETFHEFQKEVREYLNDGARPLIIETTEEDDDYNIVYWMLSRDVKNKIEL